MQPPAPREEEYATFQSTMYYLCRKKEESKEEAKHTAQPVEAPREEEEEKTNPLADAANFNTIMR